METSGTDAAENSRSVFLNDNAIILYFALFKLVIHLATNLIGTYGYIRDELYYLACSDHMAWGYVDHPPFSIAALWLSRVLFGDSLFALRLLPAISGAVVVSLAALITRELGGKRFAQFFASLCVISAPLLLAMDSLFSMNSFEVLFWTSGFYLIILALKRGEEKYWLYLGVTLGVGLLNKISVLWLGTGLAVGLLLTPQRRLFLTRRVWFTTLIAFLLFLPHIIWQSANGYPTLEFMRNAGSGKYAALSPVELLMQQTLLMNPLTFPFWFGGFVYLTLSKTSKQFRILPLVYVTVFLILAINRNSKANYFAPLVPLLFAAGGLATEKFILKLGWQWLKPAAAIVVLCGGILLAPLVLTVLPVETYISYARALGVAPATSESHMVGRLPQHYADMFGWPEMVAAIADAYNTLTPQEKADCAILCNNYGEAGAVDFFGRKNSLPKALSGHNNYWLWGTSNTAGAVVIQVGGSERDLRESYGAVVQAGIIRNDYSMPYESNLPVWICRDRRRPLRDDWQQFKVFN